MMRPVRRVDGSSRWSHRRDGRRLRWHDRVGPGGCPGWEEPDERAANGRGARGGRRGGGRCDRHRDGAGRRGRRRRARRGRPRRGRRRPRARRRRVPVLGLRPVEDDDPRRRPAGRGPSGDGDGRHRATVDRRLGAGRPADPRRGHRRLGRHASRSSGSRARAGGSCAAPDASSVRTGVVVGDGDDAGSVAERAIVVATGTRAVDPSGRRARRTSRTGRTARRSRPRRCRHPSSCSAAAPSASSWRRSSPASASGGHGRRGHAAPPRQRRAGGRRWSPTCSRRGHRRDVAGVAGRRVERDGGRFRVTPRRTAECRARAACSSPPAVGSIWRRSASTRSASTSSRRALPVDEHLRVTDRRVGGRRRHRPRGVHPRGDVPGPDRRRRHPRPAHDAGRRTTPCRG